MSTPPFPFMSLSVEALSCWRGHRSVFQGLSFSMSGGDCWQLTGSNGSGKSSLLRIIAGLLPLTSGIIRLSDTKGHQSTAEDERQPWLHYIGHNEAIKDHVTVNQQLTQWAMLLGERTPDIRAVLSPLDMASLEHLPAAYLSAGQRRRLALSRLLLAPRPLWLLDEPLNALDKRAAEALVALIASHKARGGLALIATHDTIALPNSGALPLINLSDISQTIQAL